MFNVRLLTAIVIAVLLFALGCSGSSPVTQVVPELSKDVAHQSSHYTWGLWQFVADPEAQTLDVMQLRQGNFHLNALPFLEPPPLLNLTLETLEFNGDIITADIGFRHPFLGLTEFTGYDVAGILITNGSITGFDDSDLRMAGEGDTRLLNPDGYSRWWNPTEFPLNPGTIFGYTDGLLGAPDSFADYNSTLNGYKYFTDDLDPGDPVSAVDPASRGIFSAGQKNVRTFEIQLGIDGLIFNYAVDASWMFPDGDPPWTAPDDFLPGANRPEPWRLSITETENTLWNDDIDSGGDLSLLIDVYDWFNADLNTVRVESPGNFTLVESATTTGGGVGYSTYEIDITGATPAAGEIDLLLSIVSDELDFGGFIPGINTTAYFTYTAIVEGETPPQYHWELDDGGLMYDVYLHDDLSPALAQETDGQIRCYWTADSVIGQASHPHGQSQAMASDDGGLTWSAYHQYWGHGNDGCLDHAKIYPGDNGNSYGLHPLARAGGTPGLPHYQAGAGLDLTFGYSWAFTMIRYQDCPEIIVDANGYVHTYGDRNNSDLNSGIYQQICNQQNTLYNDWTGWPDPENVPWPSMWWPLDKVLVAATPARLSDTRSCDDDSTGTIYLAYWGDTSTDYIKIARSTDGAAGLLWESVNVFEEAGYSDVRDPGLDIDANDRMHISFLRHNDTTDRDEVCYTYSTDGGDTWSNIVVVHDTLNYLTDTPIEAYEYLGADVVAITFEEDDSFYFVSSFDAGQNWIEPIEVGYGAGSSDKMPDMVVGTDNKLHFAFSHLDGTDRDIHWRNAELIED